MELVINRRGIDVNLSYEHKQQCPRCVSEGRDRSGNNLHVYGLDARGKHKGAKCFACDYTIPSEEWLEENGHVQEEEISWTMIQFTEDDHKRLKAHTTYDSKNWRGITEATSKYFGVLYEYDKEGALISQYTPNTIQGKFSGYKKRMLPKTFSALGTNGAECDLFGQFRFLKTKAKYCMIVGGEIDQLSAYQMLRDYQRQTGKTDYDPVPVASPTVGESGSFKQLQAQYEWFSRFEKIILCFDNDSAGKAATEKMVLALPKGKVYIADMTLKDPNEYLKQGKQREFVSVFYDAKPYTPVGVVGSNELYEKTLSQALTPKIPLPPFMRGLRDATAGGIPLGYIINLGAASGVGKTSFVNELIYYWVFHSPHKIGVVSMELEAGQYGEVMLSRHIQRKIALISDPQEKVDFLMRDDIKRKAEELFTTDGSSPRWHVLDDRDGSLESLKKVVEELVIALDCKVIVLDPIQDILDGLTNEEQSLFMKWQKQMVKSHMVTFININHIRKSGVGEKSGSAGAFITEEDFQGSSAIFKSGGLNVLFTRNKYAADEIERNTTHVIISKCRWTGVTGPGGEFYYDNSTHTLWDKQEWMENNPIPTNF